MSSNAHNVTLKCQSQKLWLSFIGKNANELQIPKENKYQQLPVCFLKIDRVKGNVRNLNKLSECLFASGSGKQEK